MWIIEGGRAQQSASLTSALSSISRKSLGRSSTHTLSSLSTASPVTPPIFHLLGRGLGQSGSNLYFSAAGVCAPKAAHRTDRATPSHRADARAPRILFIGSPLRHQTTKFPFFDRAEQAPLYTS